MKLELQRPGDTGDQVKAIQHLLKMQGFFGGWIGGNFGPLTEDAVRHFQSTHIGPDGRMLDIDGIVGDDTWWAMLHPSGAEQRSNLVPEPQLTEIDPIIPGGISGDRLKFLQLVVSEYRKGIKEVPDGSNSGPGIDTYLREIGLSRQPWCYAFWAWCFFKITGSYPFKSRHGHCLTGFRQAGDAGKVASLPVPGDIVIYLFRNSEGELTGSGHATVCVRTAKDRRDANCVGGNEGNRIKLSQRHLSGSSYAGCIRMFPEPEGYELGLINSGAADRNTR